MHMLSNFRSVVSSSTFLPIIMLGQALIPSVAMVRETRYHQLSANSTRDDLDVSDKETFKFTWQTIIPSSFSVYSWPFCLSILNLIAFLLWLFYHFQVFAQKSRDSQLAVLVNGTYSGHYDDALEQFQFLGIPYAKPPVGHLRFRSPQPLDDSWDGIRNATDFSPMCIGYRVSI